MSENYKYLTMKSVLAEIIILHKEFLFKVFDEIETQGNKEVIRYKIFDNFLRCLQRVSDYIDDVSVETRSLISENFNLKQKIDENKKYIESLIDSDKIIAEKVAAQLKLELFASHSR